MYESPKKVCFLEILVQANYSKLLMLITMIMIRFLHSKGPKNVLCPFPGSIQNVAIAPAQCFVLALKKRQGTFLGP